MILGPPIGNDLPAIKNIAYYPLAEIGFPPPDTSLHCLVETLGGKWSADVLGDRSSKGACLGKQLLTPDFYGFCPVQISCLAMIAVVATNTGILATNVSAICLELDPWVSRGSLRSAAVGNSQFQLTDSTAVITWKYAMTTLTIPASL